MIVISRELLKIMYPECEEYCGYPRNRDVTFLDLEDMEINVYELAHKCKEWALEKDYSINSFKDFTNMWFSYVSNPIEGYSKQFTGITESETIFKACQWILENKASK